MYCGAIASAATYGYIAGKYAAGIDLGNAERAKEDRMVASRGAEGVSAQGMSLVDGAYESVSHGYGGEVPVTVVIEAGRIASIEVGENGETPSLGGRAIEKMPAQIVEANGTAGIDVFAGASYTSRAIFSAVEDCLGQASL